MTWRRNFGEGSVNELMFYVLFMFMFYSTGGRCADVPGVVGHVEAAQEGHVLLPARGEAAGGEGVAEAAQAAGEVMWRSRDEGGAVR